MRSTRIDACACRSPPRNAPDLFGLRFLDAHQSGVAQFRRAGLDGQQRGQRHFDVLEPAVFEFTLDLDSGLERFDIHDDAWRAAAP